VQAPEEWIVWAVSVRQAIGKVFREWLGQISQDGIAAGLDFYGGTYTRFDPMRLARLCMQLPALQMLELARRWCGNRDHTPYCQ
jgi:hypothetical protein